MDRKYIIAGVIGAITLSCLAIAAGLPSNIQMAAFLVGLLVPGFFLYKANNETNMMDFRGHWYDIVRVIGLYVIFALCFPGMFIESVTTPRGLLAHGAILASLAVYVFTGEKRDKDAARRKFFRRWAQPLIGLVVIFGLVGLIFGWRIGDATIQCNDGIDNDGDGLVDMADAQCANPLDTCESGSCSTLDLLRENNGLGSGSSSGGGTTGNGGNDPRFAGDPLAAGVPWTWNLHAGAWASLGYCEAGNSIQFNLSTVGGVAPYSYRLRFGSKEGSFKFWENRDYHKATKLTLSPGQDVFVQCPHSGVVKIMQPQGRSHIRVQSGAPDVSLPESQEKAASAGPAPSIPELVEQSRASRQEDGVPLKVFGLEPGSTKCGAGRTVCDAAFRSTSYRSTKGHEFVLRVSTPVTLAVKVNGNIIGQVKATDWVQEGSQWSRCINGRATDGSVQVPSGVVSVANRGNVPVNVTVAAK